MTTSTLAPESTTVPALSSRAALDAFYLEVRCKLLDVAAILDRIDRGGGAEELEHDMRLVRVRKALELLQDEGPGRAEELQKLFSLEYDPSWEKPAPRF